MAHDINIAEQVQRAEKEVRERRKYAEVYVQILEKYLARIINRIIELFKFLLADTI